MRNNLTICFFCAIMRTAILERCMAAPCTERNSDEGNSCFLYRFFVFLRGGLCRHAFDPALTYPFDPSGYDKSRAYVALWSWNGTPADLPGHKPSPKINLDPTLCHPEPKGGPLGRSEGSLCGMER